MRVAYSFIESLMSEGIIYEGRIREKKQRVVLRQRKTEKYLLVFVILG